MNISRILQRLILGLFTVFLGGVGKPQYVSALEESCVGENCERSHTLTETYNSQHSFEQESTDTLQEKIPENLEGQLREGVNHFDSDEFVNSRDPANEDESSGHAHNHHLESSENDDSSVDNHPENSDVFRDSDAKQKMEVNSPLENEEIEDTEASPPNGDHDHESVSPSLEIIGFPKVYVHKNIHEDRKDNTEQQAEQQVEQPVTRRRYFPLLYTIRTLLQSFLSEFGDDGGGSVSSFNASETSSGNLTALVEQSKDSNATVNATDSSRKTRFQCAVKNIASNTTGEVKIVNSTRLLEILNFSKNQKASACVLVMFYAPWCHFCARAAPHYNALARAFPQLDVLAVDTSHFSYLNARFGTVAVPNLMLFHARSAVRFNHTARVLENFIQFVTNNTGLEPDSSVKLEPDNYIGPLPSVVVRGRDWLLWLAWTFVIICSAYGFVKSHYGQSFITRLRVLWQEHQHIE